MAIDITSAGKEKPEREEVVEPLVEPTPERRKDREDKPIEVPDRELIPA
jgi:hypothetical protein